MIHHGYEFVENHIDQNTLLFFRMSPDGEKLENIHICEKSSAKSKQFITMRDFFRAFPGKAKEYSDIKEKNIEMFPENYQAYRSGKKPFLDQMEKEAYEWEESQNHFRA